MNRELKFSLWDKVKKKWLLKEFSMIGENMMMGVYMQILNDYFPDRLNDLVLVQYTGKKDKNGKEIYEGDTVMHEWHGLMRVVWTAGTFWYILLRYPYNGFPMHFETYPRTEVTGSIYDVPELLEEK